MLNRLAIMLLLFLLAPAVAPASLVQLPQTGQVGCWNSANPAASIPCAGTGQDGDLQTGKPWPSTRFADNANGTVTDNLTGLVWLKDAGCFGTANWADALAAAATLAGDGSACNLFDSSAAGSWRLPNAVEMQSLEGPSAIDGPTLPAGNPFVNVQGNSSYWTSTSYVAIPQDAWALGMSIGWIRYTTGPKSNLNNYMLVRDP